MQLTNYENISAFKDNYSIIPQIVVFFLLLLLLKCSEKKKLWNARIKHKIQ